MVIATTRDVDEADVVLINTCSIRDNAEKRVRNRLTEFKKKKEGQPRNGRWYFRLYGRTTKKISSRARKTCRFGRWTRCISETCQT